MQVDAPDPVAPWERRIADLRVYYDVEDEPTAVVCIRPVGAKMGNQVRIGGGEIEL